MKVSDASAASSDSARKSSSKSEFSSFEHPDFAFPDNVRKDASEVFEKAMSAGNPERALLAAMQLNVADNLTSSDSISLVNNRYAEIKNKFSTPWSNVAALLMAQNLCGLYRENKWIYDERVLPPDQLDANPQLWSGVQFRRQISILCDEALKDFDALGSMDITRIDSLLSNLPDDNPDGLSVADFIVNKVLGILEEASISDSKANPTNGMTPLALIDRLITLDESRAASGAANSDAGRALLQARLKKLGISDENQDPDSPSAPLTSGYASTLLELYPEGNPLRAELICNLYNSGRFNTESQSNKILLYQLVGSECKAATGKIADYLRWIAQSLMQPSYRLSTPSQWLSEGDSISLTASNIAEGYLLMVPISSDQAEADRIYNKNLVSVGNIREVLHILRDITVPSQEVYRIGVDNLTPGYYAIVMSKNRQLTGLFENLRDSRPDIVLVSNLSCFISNDAHRRLDSNSSANVGDKFLYVVEGSNNVAVRGAQVTFHNTQYNHRGEKKILTTDADGKVDVPFEQCRAVIKRGDDRLLWSGGKSYLPRARQMSYHADILTDLAIYHPGDTVQLALVLSESDGREVKIVRGHEVRVTMSDANAGEVAAEKVITDRYGRARCSLLIPSDGLTGRFMIQVADSHGGMVLGNNRIEVAEYKAPTFRVLLDQPSMEKASGSGQPSDMVAALTNDVASAANSNIDKITVSGSVITYSGAPLADSQVEIKVNFQPWWGWRYYPGARSQEYGVKAITGADGRFTAEINLPDSGGNPYQFGRFYATATATSAAGETQSSERRSFAVGEGYELNYYSPEEIEAGDDDLVLKVEVVDILGNKVQKDLEFKLERLNYEGDKVIATAAEGKFLSPKLSLDSAELPSGSYRLSVVLPEAVRVNKDGEPSWQPETLSQDLVIWRPGDARPPKASALWIPVKRINTIPGQKDVTVSVGASYADEWIYMEVADCNGITMRKWLRPEGRNVTVRIPAPENGNSLSVNFEGCHNLDQIQGNIRIFPPVATRVTEFRVETFRDHIVPGSQESWRFRLMSGWNSEKVSDNDTGLSPLRNAPVMAVMTNQALDALMPFNWNFHPSIYLDYTTIGGIQIPYHGTTNAFEELIRLKHVSCPLSFEYPDFIYTLSSGRGMMYRKLTVRGVYASAKAEAMEYDGVSAADMNMMMDTAEMELEESPVETAGSAENSGEAKSEESVNMRAMEMPLAFFRPDLTTDDNGNVDVTFTVPDFNTTWVLQIAGYDMEGNSATSKFITRASKPVMVAANMPRFLLTGDQASISATIFNATDEAQIISGRIEIFDVGSGKVLKREDVGASEFAANSSQVATIDIPVPRDVNQLGVRVIAESVLGSDGEQGIVQVLPSSSPVRDATTFYLTPGQHEFRMRLPKMDLSGSVTFNYCDNPFWYVLTALSGALDPDSESALDQVVALYANTVSTGLPDKHPRLKEGLRLMLNDDPESSSLTLSPLSKNQSLKITELNSTPWVNNAVSETMRMSGLGFLLDKKAAEKAISDAIDRLEKTRNSNGAWSWMKGMPASTWITEQVLSALGRMKASGYLPADDNSRRRLESMISAAIAFTDSEEANYFREVVKRDKGVFPLTHELSYLYLRSNACSKAATGLIAEMQADMLRRLPKEWRSLDINNKAIAAIMLKRSGNPELAHTLLESISQFASYQPDKGMWFDQASNNLFSPSLLLLTSQCLDAFNEVDPHNPAVERLAQYLVLSRQTTDWNLELGQAGVACVVNSVVNSIKDSVMPEEGNGCDAKVYLNGKEIATPSRIERLTGSYYVDLDASEASAAELVIVRKGESPAWGGVLNQYVLPMREVKAHSVPQLKIEKQLLPVSIDESGIAASESTTHFHKGDKIRVTLTISTDRDLDYLLIADQLGAWMQPADQLTRYEACDGIWMLTETRTAKKNFYITRMPKGKYIISYDVNADRDGEYSIGIADAQSQYYPLICAHSAGAVVEIQSTALSPHN